MMVWNWKKFQGCGPAAYSLRIQLIESNPVHRIAISSVHMYGEVLNCDAVALNLGQLTGGSNCGTRMASRANSLGSEVPGNGNL